MNGVSQCSLLGDGGGLVPISCVPPFNGVPLDIPQILLYGGAGFACILIGLALVIWSAAAYREARNPEYQPCETCDKVSQ